MRVLLVGSGGREHALAWHLAQSPLLTALIAAPGNPGIARHARLAPVAADDPDALAALAREQRVDLVVVGPEAPLVAGLADRCTALGIPCFGPSAAAAALEGSKAFMKRLAVAAGIPTARHSVFTDVEAARAVAAAGPFPIVVKADGLAGGKGVFIATNAREAVAAVDDIMAARRFGAAGATVMVEDYLEGEEASLFALTDGEGTVRFLGACQDHKRAHEGDRGPNTGGMGAYVPAPVMTEAVTAAAMARIVTPAARALAQAGTPFRGVLFAGLMVTAEGPQLIEFNARFGDPETQALLPMMAGDLLPALQAAATDRLHEAHLPGLHSGAAVGIVLAARGYPDAPTTGSVIRNVEAAEATGALVFHAGTHRNPQGQLVAAGGRVLTVTARGASVTEAAARAREAAALIDWPEGFHRRDIGWRAIAREREVF